MQLPWYSKIATKNYARTAWVTLAAYVIARTFAVLTSSILLREFDWANVSYHLNPLNGNHALAIVTALLFIFTLFRASYGEPREILTSVIKIVVVLTVIGYLFGEPFGLFSPDKPTVKVIVTVIAQFIAFNLLLSLDVYGSTLEAAQRADKELGITTDASHEKRIYWFRYCVIAVVLYFGFTLGFPAYSEWRNQPVPENPTDCRNRVLRENVYGNLTDAEWIEKLKTECGESN